jgi:hypothetical protein
LISPAALISSAFAVLVAVQVLGTAWLVLGPIAVAVIVRVVPLHGR